MVPSAFRVVDSIGLSSFVRRLSAPYHDALNSFRTFALLFARPEGHIGAVAFSRTGDPGRIRIIWARSTPRRSQPPQAVT